MARTMQTKNTRIRHACAVAAAGLSAVVALPAAADAAVIRVDGDRVVYREARGEINDVRMSVRDAATVQFVDDTARITPGIGCSQVNGVFLCRHPSRFRDASITLGGRDDSFTQTDARSPLQVGVDGGPGNDTYLAGVAFHPTRVLWSGGDGIDTATWARSDRAVDVVMQTGAERDGRQGFDRDTIRDDTERLIGSAFGDTLVGADVRGGLEEIQGGRGTDTIEGRLGRETFLAEAGADGADRFDGGPDGGLVSYERRTTPITVTANDGFANDGAPGEGDNLVNASGIIGGSAGDTILVAGTPPGLDLPMRLLGLAGDDKIFGSNARDEIVAGAGADTVFANGGDDTIAHASGLSDNARDDLAADTIDGGAGTDRVFSGSGDRVTA
jgi:Ca2+-binding RTX toxin-like protein